jgi:hypothetical protein
MISTKSLLIALNVKGKEVATTVGLTEQCFAGRTLDGDLFERDPNKNYIRFDLLNNDIDRRNLSDNEAETMLGGIYQVSVYVSKIGKKIPDIEAQGLIDSIRPLFQQGMKLESGGQSVRIYRTDVSPQLSNDTHIYYAVSVYFEVIA